MSGQFFKTLIGKDQAGELETQIWQCNPLLVADKDGTVVFSGNTDIEFTPHERDERTGHAVSLTPSAEGARFEIEVTERMDVLRTKAIEMWSRGGVTLLGVDPERNKRRWESNKGAGPFMLDPK